ncbi:MAG: WxcM-like domain-containing protein [Acidimicrobiales bacterium]
MATYVHPLGCCETERVGEGTRIWAFAHVLPGAVIGADCNICDHVFIENDVIVGDRVTVKCGVQLWDGVRLGNDVFVGPNATFTNDRRPRSRQWQQAVLETVIEDGASIGANATLLPGLTIGRGAMVGAGAVITRNVPPYAVVVGNPGRIIGYEGAAVTSSASGPTTATEGGSDIGVGEVRLIEFPSFTDLRGDLAVMEFQGDFPFVPLRQFIVSGVTSGHVRGEHAHRRCSQFLTCVSGSMEVLVDDGWRRARVRLDRPSVGLLVPPGVWAAQFNFTSDAVLVVLASRPYEAEDYIRDYSDYRAEYGSSVES